MKLNDRLFILTPQGKFRLFTGLFVLALCLASLGARALFYSPGNTRPELDTLRAREVGESPLLHVVEPRPEYTPPVRTSALVGSAGSKVYVDPATGKIGPPPPESQGVTSHLPQEAQNALSTSADGLVQTPLTGPAGGVKIDLQGRFRSAVVATLDAQGKLSTRCAPDTVGAKDSLEPMDNPTLPGVTEREGIHREK